MFKNILFKTLLFTITIVFVFALSTKAKANNLTVVINEVMWSGSTLLSSDEWIELKNISNQVVNIKNWSIENLGKSNQTIYIPENIDYILNPGEFFLISKFALGESSILNIEPDCIVSNLSLSNSGNGNLVLKDESGNIIDIAKGDTWPAGNNDIKSSMERIDYDDGLNIANWQSSYNKTNLIDNINDFATPKSENSAKIFNQIAKVDDLNYLINFENILGAKAVVTEIIDGDTIKVNINGMIKTVRLSGIDTPEAKKSSSFKVDEPYYQETKELTKEKLLNKEIDLLVSIDSNERYDLYQRIIGIIIVDNELFNIQLLSYGYARTFYLNNLMIQENNWLEIEELAKQQKLGIWNDFGSDCIRINKFMPNPSGEDKNNEWMEIYNQCSYEVNIKNWIIDDKDGGSNPYLIDDDLLIKPYDFYVFYSSQTNISLNNDIDEVRIFNPTLFLVDSVSYNENFLDDEVYLKCNDNWQKQNEYQLFALNSCSNKNNQINSISDLNEIKKNTQVSVEGVVNSLPGNLAKQYFFIEDNSMGIQIYSNSSNFPSLEIGQKILVTGFLSDTKYLRLKISNPNDILILDTIRLEAKLLKISEINKTYSGKLLKIIGKVVKKSSNIFFLSDGNKEIKIEIRAPTGIKINNIYLNQEVELVGVLYESSSGDLSILPRYKDDIRPLTLLDGLLKNINYIFEYPLNSFVKIKGVVILQPGIFSNLYFYIQDETAGIQIYFSKKKFPNLKLGNMVEIYGKITSNYNRLLIYSPDDIKIISSNNEVVINEVLLNISNYLSRLVKISGFVIDKKSNKIIINNNGRLYNVYIKTKTKIKTTDIKKGDYLEIVGIVEKISNEFRIIPRFSSDIYHIEYSQNIKKTSTKDETNKKYSIKSALFNNPNLKLNKYIDKESKKSYNNTIILLKTIIILLEFLLIIIIFYPYAKIFFNKGEKSTIQIK